MVPVEQCARNDRPDNDPQDSYCKARTTFTPESSMAASNGYFIYPAHDLRIMAKIYIVGSCLSGVTDLCCKTILFACVDGRTFSPRLRRSRWRYCRSFSLLKKLPPKELESLCSLPTLRQLSRGCQYLAVGELAINSWAASGEQMLLSREVNRIGNQVERRNVMIKAFSAGGTHHATYKV